MTKTILHLLVLLLSCHLSAAAPDSLTIIDHGSSDYSIVIPAQADSIEQRAAGILQEYLYQMSGLRLDVRAGDTTGQNHFIYLDRLTEEEEARTVEKIHPDGYFLKSLGRNLHVSGGSDKGLLYAVYQLLDRQLGCRYYAPGAKRIPQRKKIVLPAMLQLSNPTFDFREVLYRHVYEQEFMEWHALDSHRLDWGYWCHSFFTLVPPEEYFESHPEYFSLINGRRIASGQLCLSNEDVFNILVKNLRRVMGEHPGVKFWSVSQNDNVSWCQCEQCQVLNDLEGSPTGSVIHFINRVAAEFPDKIISTLAYQYSRAAPREIKPRRNVNIMLCSIECNRSLPLAADPSSATFVRDVQDWGALTDNILLWDYVIQFKHLVSPFPNLRVLQPNLKFFRDNHISAIFEQGNREVGGEFAELRAYLIARLMWDVDTDMDALMNDFLTGYYGPAGAHIRAYIDLLHDKLEQSGASLDIFGNPRQPIDSYLRPHLMDRYNQLFDRAEHAVRHDSLLLQRVHEARMPLMYAELEQAKIYATGPRGLYEMDSTGSWHPRKHIDRLLDRFISLCRRQAVTRLHEWDTTPDEYEQEYRHLLSVGMQKHLALFKDVRLKYPASVKYPAGGPAALTNGLRGGKDYTVNWLGFEANNLEAVIDLGAEQSISSIAVNFLQDIQAWIFLPLQVEFYASQDGQHFDLLKKRAPKADNSQPGAFIENFSTPGLARRARYIKIKARNCGRVPAWHRGAGGKAWIFADEVIVK